jgi:hypothetical protein
MRCTTLKVKALKMTNHKVNCIPYKNIAYKNLYNVVPSNGFNVYNKCITYVIMGILTLPHCVNGMALKNTSPLRQANMTFNNGCLATLSQSSKQMVAAYM